MRVFRWAIIAVLVFGATASYAADDAPPIRQFDIPTIERLGREMYERDQLAWKATDILFTRHKKEELAAQKQRGWIVDSYPDHAVVRFIRETDLGPMLSYDVTFTAGQVLNYSEPQAALLSGEELAQYNARMTALKNVDRMCTENLNTIVLKDPKGDDWLVWAMAATTDPKLIVVGGHYRFSISSDGKTILQKDALSRNCQNFTREKGTDGEQVQLVMTQVVSNIPVETYVFDTLSYGQALRVGTPDGKVWKIDDGKIVNIDMDMPGVDGMAARVLTGLDEKCELMVTDVTHPADKPLTVDIDSVISSTEGEKKFEPKIPKDAKAEAVMCGRNDFLLAPNDYKVLARGIVLYIVDRGKGHPERMGALEISGGEFRFREVKGAPLIEQQEKQINARLNAFQTAIQSSNKDHL